MPTPLERVTDYAEALARLTAQSDATRAQRDEAIRAAHADGVSVSAIADAARVSRVSVYTILNQT